MRFFRVLYGQKYEYFLKNQGHFWNLERKIGGLKKKFAPKNQFLADFGKSDFSPKIKNFKMLQNRRKIGRSGPIFFSNHLFFSEKAENNLQISKNSQFCAKKLTLKTRFLRFLSAFEVNFLTQIWVFFWKFGGHFRIFHKK